MSEFAEGVVNVSRFPTTSLFSQLYSNTPLKTTHQQTAKQNKGKFLNKEIKVFVNKKLEPIQKTPKTAQI